MTIKPCIICGTPSLVPDNSEIVSCNNDHCVHIIENNIGIHTPIFVDKAVPGIEHTGIMTIEKGSIISIHYL